MWTKDCWRPKYHGELGIAAGNVRSGIPDIEHEWMSRKNKRGASPVRLPVDKSCASSFTIESGSHEYVPLVSVVNA